ncbi:MAG TPA: hypothetical protein VGG10_16370 [Rhizomicrobium sp.]|jgi:hypothetical protein
MNTIRDRLFGVPAALLLQLLFIAILIYGLQPLLQPKSIIREVTLILPRTRPPAPEPLVRSRRPAALRPGRQRPSQIATPLVLPDRTAAPPAANVQSFGKSLFDCAPENFANLSDEDQAHCPKPGADLAARDAPNLLGSRSHVQDEAHWEAELAYKKSQLWLPCFATATTRTGNKLPAVDFVCVAAKLADGTLTDPHTWPLYKTQTPPPNELYKIEQRYAAWHRAHDEKPKSETSSASPDN